MDVSGSEVAVSIHLWLPFVKVATRVARLTNVHGFGRFERERKRCASFPSTTRERTSGSIFREVGDLVYGLSRQVQAFSDIFY